MSPDVDLSRQHDPKREAEQTKDEPDLEFRD